MSEPKTAVTQEFLKHTFSPIEMNEIAGDLARTTAEIAEANEAKKAVTAQFGEKIATLQARANSLARQFNNGYEFRNIDCKVLYHDPSPAQKTIVRLDTGETVKVQAMNQSELQEILQFTPQPEPAPEQESAPEPAAPSESAAESGQQKPEPEEETELAQSA